jgi:hypothetical protein
MTTKTTADGFVWLIVTDSAKELFSSGALSLYELRDDDSEALIDTYDELNKCLEQGADIGIEVGFLKDIIKQ